MHGTVTGHPVEYIGGVEVRVLANLYSACTKFGFTADRCRCMEQVVAS